MIPGSTLTAIAVYYHSQVYSKSVTSLYSSCSLLSSCAFGPVQHYCHTRTTSMTTMAPWILYKLLRQDSSLHRQMQVANSTLATTASAMELNNSNAARLTDELQRAAHYIESANRPGRALNKTELAVRQMRAGAAAAPATNSEVERLFGRLDNSTRRKRKRI